jgi:hypothetical protein
MITITAQMTISGETIDFNRRNLISIGSSIFDRSDIKRPSYGIISNTGELEFNDYDGEFLNYAEQGLLTSDLPIVIFLNNTLSKAKQQIATFETREWDYDNDNRSVRVSLKDDLEEWQDITVYKIPYNPTSNSSVSLEYYYTWLRIYTPAKYKMLAFKELDAKTQEILKTTVIPYNLLDGGNLWSQWQKVCEVCALYIYKNGEGRTVCNYTYGS